MARRESRAGPGGEGRIGWLLRPPGLVPYAAANPAMHELAERRLAGEVPDTLILLEHPPVYTAGRRWKPEHITWTEDRIREAGAELHFIDRGGSLTFHGPGQLVAYPIIELGAKPDALGYVRRLEEVVIRAAADVGVELHRSDVQTGVWSGERKVCAIGVRLMRARVTLHGFALNCTTDLSWFDAIVPCGLADEGVASLSQLAGREVTVADVTVPILRHFERVFDIELESCAAEAGVFLAPAAAVP
ncbi:MAG: lipoyl(octanoyl) transferase LipB [Actinomycetota bacterium]